jgi:hypothetical protein
VESKERLKQEICPPEATIYFKKSTNVDESGQIFNH